MTFHDFQRIFANFCKIFMKILWKEYISQKSMKFNEITVKFCIKKFCNLPSICPYFQHDP
jgi:hypothetical protein